jgi:hypothetical protein
MRREFFQSPHHAALAAATLGVGFATGEPLYFILGAAAYVVGWVYLPDMGFFRRWIEGKQQAQLAAAEATEAAGFKARRDAVLNSLTSSRRQRYAALADVCDQIEQSATDPDDPRVRKLEELMWTFARLLSTDQTIQRFLELESRENLPKLAAAAEAEVKRLEAEASPDDAHERLLSSRRDYLETLQKRAQRVEQARRHFELVGAEEDRLEQQIKLLRAEAMSAPSTAALSARLDATVEQLEATNTYLREMDQFRALLAEPAMPSQRIGFGPGVPPPPPQRQRTTEQ